MSEQVFTNLTNCGPVSVYVNDGVVTRIRPLVADDEADFKPWVIEADGKKYSPPKKFNLAPMVHAERRRLYSDERIKYPMKRVDFDPNGERNPQNRGKSAYERISWDEALDIVASEIARVKKTYGSSAISGMTSSHHNWGIVGYKMGPFMRFMNCLEATPVFDNPDSWEGWHWGATHTYGFYWRLGMPEPFDNLQDVLKNAEIDRLLVERPRHHARAPTPARSRPSGARGSRRRASRWSSSTPSTTTRTRSSARPSGSRRAWAPTRRWPWRSPTCGSPRTPTTRSTSPTAPSASTSSSPTCSARPTACPRRRSGRPRSPASRRASSARWRASGRAKRTILTAGARGGEGSACRTAYGTEWARMMVLLQAMQGLGKPGVTIGGTTMGAPADFETWFPAYAEPQGRMSHSTKAANYIPQNPTKQRLWRLTVPDAILDPPVEWDGAGFCGQSLEQQFEHFVYPAEGCSEIKLWYRYGGSFMGTMTDTTKWVRMYQSPKLEFVVNQDIWYNSETRMADVILPACTNFERDDIGEFAACNGYTTNSHTGNNYRVIVREKKCIEPLWESKSDYQILADLVRAARPPRRVHRRRQDRGRLGQGASTTSPTWPRRSTGRPSTRRATTSSTPPRTTSRRRACAGSPRAAPATRPTPATPSAAPTRRTSSAPTAARSSSRPRASRRTSRTTRSGRSRPRYIESWEGHHTDRALREVPAAAHVAAPALLVPLPLRQAHRLARRHPGPPHQEGRLRVVAGAAQPGGRGRARHPQRRHRAPVQRPRLRALLRGRHRAGPARASSTATRRRPSTTRSSRARPTPSTREGA